MFESSTKPQWERQTLEKILLEHIKEQRRIRRWSIFFKIAFLGLVAWAVYTFYYGELPQPIATTQAHTAVIDIIGEIGANEVANADNIRDSLKSAFANKMVKGVVLRINSPGGSPVQSRQVYSEIKALRKKYPEIKIYSAIEDMGTSAAYLIAAAADEIYADKTSLVGSIGVKIDSFGFVEAMNKVGVERRLYTAGKFKGILDPFTPRHAEEDTFIIEQLKSVHKAFIENVKEGRGMRLHESPDIFSGLFWSGEQAYHLGLTDGFGDAQFIAKEIIKAENLVDYSPSSGLIDRLAKKVGASISEGLSTQLGLIQKGVR